MKYFENEFYMYFCLIKLLISNFIINFFDKYLIFFLKD